MIQGVGDVHVARAIDRHARGIVEACRTARAIDAAGTPGQAGQGRHRTGRGNNLADRVVVGVCHVEVARVVRSDRSEVAEPGGAACAVAAATAQRLSSERADGH